MDAPSRKQDRRVTRSQCPTIPEGRQNGPSVKAPRAVDYRRLFEYAPDAILIVDSDGHYIDANLTVCQLTGYTRDELLRMRVGDLAIPSQRTYSAERFDLLRKAGRTRGDRILQRKNGTTVPVEVHVIALGNDTFLTIVHDISEREAIERRIRDAQKLESLVVLAGGIAHDFNSSLMVILGNTALLRSLKGFPPKAVEHIELIEEAGARAHELIKHLLTYARTGRHNPQPTDLNTVIQDTFKLVRSSVGKQHELDLKLQKPLPTIVADQSQVEQIILNLCLNAKEAMPDRGAIEIATREADLTPAQMERCVPYDAKPGRYVEMVVSDRGSGMEPVTVRQIFDPFFTTKAEGHGLGMAAVLGILRQHNAVALVDSKLGEGTHVHVFFPVRQEEPGSSGPEPNRKQKSPSRRTQRHVTRRRRD